MSSCSQISQQLEDLKQEIESLVFSPPIEQLQDVQQQNNYLLKRVIAIENYINRLDAAGNQIFETIELFKSFVEIMVNLIIKMVKATTITAFLDD
ncbi:MAG: hypothetical protein QNJ47_27025 [Nostocaceae cyanobacterium]|nr:hypothetical protein [Nostocaceae cyanobacterium]